MHKWIAVGVLLAGAAQAQAQEVREERPWIVNAELFGRAGLGSVNVERYFDQYVGIGAGLGYFPCLSSDICNSDAAMVPVYLSVNPIGNVSSLYLSVGGVFGFAGSDHFAVWVAQLGYQLQLHGGFFLRPALQVYFKKGSTVAGLDLLPWAGLALGYSF